MILKKEKKCLFAGSFDPITNGHLYILKKSIEIFDKVFLVVTKNLKKNSKLNLNFRFKLVKNLIKKHNFSNVEVLINESELTSVLAKNLDCNYLIRGIRSVNEFEKEKVIAKNNFFINENLTTLFIMVPEPDCYVSSSVFWEIFFYKKEAVEKYVDKDIVFEIENYLKRIK